jgi:prophage antirepressor-like protein
MNDLQIFNNPDFGEIRVIDINGEGWFVGRDVAMVLGYAKPQNAIAAHVDIEDTLKRGVLDSNGKTQQTTLINESGVYALIILSELPSAKKFKRWVTSEVLPSIRRTGGYNLPVASPNELIVMLAQANMEVEKRVAVIEESTRAIETKLDTAIKVFSAPDKDHWRGDAKEKISELVRASGNCDMKMRGILYNELERTANVKLNSRLANMRSRYKKQGHTYREANALSKLDAIDKDKQLRAIFDGIARKYQAIYN